MLQKTKDFDAEIIKLYNDGLSCNKIAKILGFSKTSIRNFLKRKNIPIRNDQSIVRKKYTLNRSFFEKINTEQKAYILGLIYSDGNISSKANRLTITITEDDSDILYKIKFIMNYNGPIYKYEKRKTSRAYSRLCICDKKIIIDLKKIGLISNKSLALKFPKDIPPKLINHFVRGYFDGDGSISFNKKKKVSHISICSTNRFIKTLKIILKLINVNCSIYNPKNCLLRGNKVTQVMQIGGNKQVLCFLNWLYKNSTIFLKRKYNVYSVIKDMYTNGSIRSYMTYAGISKLTS